MRADSGWLKGLNPTVAIVSKVVVASFVLFTILYVDIASGAFVSLRDGIIATLNWLYIGLVALTLFFVLWIAVSRFGHVRLGADDDRPEFGYFSWFAMLFAAGMGIGLVFFSIAEPITHFSNNPFTGESADKPAAQMAMRLTFFHWGLHPWAIYALVALCFAYFSYRRDLPLTIRSAFYPLIGDRIYGPLGHAIDILAVFATTFGIATSLGFGVRQINTGLNILIGLEVSAPIQVVLIAIITFIAVISVVSGVGRGIRILSELNFWLSVLLLLFVASFGPTAQLIEGFLQSVGDYLQNIIALSFWTATNSADGSGEWQSGWTTFYWGWWISWAPFVGMFIARISKGRTIREFILGVVLVPTLVTFFWLSVMGGTALNFELANPGVLSVPVADDNTKSLYKTITLLDGGTIGLIMQAVATILIVTYFVTSSDSGTLVINTILSVGDPEPPIPHRILWGATVGAVAAVLILAGGKGLGALQAAAISAALPFSIIMLFMAIGLTTALNRYERRPETGQDPSP